MKKIYLVPAFLLSVFLLIFTELGAQNQVQNQTDTAMVHAATRLIGLDFDQKEIEQMAPGVIRDSRNYGAIRNYLIANKIAPSIQFNPIPAGLVIPPDRGKNNWNIPNNVELPDNRADLAYLSIPQLASLLKNKKISSLELTEFFLERLKKYNPELLCVVNLTEEDALKQARKADNEINQGSYRGILHGIPYGVKDLLSYPGYPTTWGAMPYKDQMIDETASLIQKLEEAGAVLVAKLSLGALAMGDVWFGGTTKNPWNTENGSSGSSAGPASAVSAGLIPFAIGSETLGSIVSPSTRCAVSGLRPGFGRVSKHGAMALSWSMDKLGPICRSASDCAVVFDYIRGADGQDLSAFDASFVYPALESLKGLKIGYLKSLFDQKYAYQENDAKSLEVLQELGAELIAVELPDQFPINAMRIILTAEAAAAFNELTLSNQDSLLVSQDPWSWPNTFRSARLIPAVEYIQANRIRSELIRELNNLFKQYDLIIAPSFVGSQLTMTNLSGHPALLLPNGFTPKDEPSSFTLLGNHFGEGLLCAVGQLYQDKTAMHKRRPPKFN